MSHSEHTNQRITHLEATLAFQERTIEQLNQVVTTQQSQVDKLTLAVEQMARKLKDLEDLSGPNVGPASEEPPPPHY